MPDTNRIYELRLHGYCCSQIVLKMGMENAGCEENPDLIQASRGLCDGMHTGMTCGVLTAAACLFSLLLPDKARMLTTDLVEWFRGEFEEINGGITCNDIMAGDPMNRFNKCPQILAATYDEILILLEANGYEF